MMNLRGMLPVLLLVGCGSSQDLQSQLEFESAHSVALEGEIQNGVMYTKSSFEAIYPGQIEDQLMYSIGQLNGDNGGTDVNRTQIVVKSTKEIEEGLYRVEYQAKIFIAWPVERLVPKEYELILPEQADSEGLYEFFKLYGDEESKERCLDYSAHEVSLGVFWYYYRPNSWYCPLKKDRDAKGVVRVPVELRISEENSMNKSPEYVKVWEDERLVVTSIFGMNDEEGGDNDVGVRAYNSLYRNLINAYGKPIRSNVNLAEGENPSLDNPEVRMVFKSGSGEIQVNLFLVSGIRSVGFEFMEKYNELSQYSDFIAYNGHSGLGANIRALANMGQFVKGQYQLFLVNGCDTFAYVDDALKSAHERVNPGEPANKYFDLITNAMPAYFTSLAQANMSVIESLAAQDRSYKEILSGFDESQRANVTGEEDNGYWN